jgi:hypothetical protein
LPYSALSWEIWLAFGEGLGSVDLDPDLDLGLDLDVSGGRWPALPRTGRPGPLSEAGLAGWIWLWVWVWLSLSL